MVSYWKLDETAGSIAEDSVGIYNGTLDEGTWVKGKVNNSIYFNGVYDSGYINVGNELSMDNSFTLEAWLKPDEDITDQSREIILRGHCDYDISDPSCWLYNYVLDIWEGDIRFGFYSGEDPDPPFNWALVIDDTTPLNKGNWYHIVGVVEDRSYIKLYVNGTQTEYTGTPYSPNATFDHPTTIGGVTFTWEGSEYVTNVFNGTLDEVALYNRALSETEVQQHHEQGLFDRNYCEPLLHVYDLSVIYNDSNRLLNIFEFKLKNYNDLNLRNISWNIDFGDGNTQ